MSSLELRQNLLEAFDKLPTIQQIKLLEFVNSMLSLQKEKQPKPILKFAGIFDHQDEKDFEEAMKDFQQIDENEW